LEYPISHLFNFNINMGNIKKVKLEPKIKKHSLYYFVKNARNKKAKPILLKK